MKPIAKGRAIIAGNITIAEPRGGKSDADRRDDAERLEAYDLQDLRRALVIVFDTDDDLRKAMQYGAIDAPLFGPSESSKEPGA